MKKIKIKITEECGCEETPQLPKDPYGHMHTSDCEKPTSYKNVHNSQEARMHRTTLAHLMADVKVLLDLVQDGDDLPEWLETKITKAGDYMSSAARYIAGNIARDQGQLEEEVTDEEEQQLKKIKIQLKKASKMHKAQSDKIDDIIDEQKHICEVTDYFNLYEELQNAVDEDGETPCPQCLYETIVEADCGCPDMLEEATYQGRKVKIGKPTRNKKGSSKSKFSVYVKGCAKDKSRVTKISFGDPNMKIKKSNPKRRKSFRARHKCATAKDRCTARYWSCKKW